MYDFIHYVFCLAAVAVPAYDGGVCWGVCVQVLGGASGGVWSEGKEKTDAAAQPSTWNVDVFVQVVKELVRRTTLRFERPIWVLFGPYHGLVGSNGPNCVCRIVEI